MSDFLMGSEKSGTPLETRGAAGNAGRFFESAFQGGQFHPELLADPFTRLSREAAINIFGGSTTGDLTAGLFNAMEPFERRETERAVAGQRGAFGTAGGRFSRNLLSAEGELRGELANRFELARRQRLLEAGGLLLGANQLGFQQAFAPFQAGLQFIQPGAPVFQEGVLPGLLAAGGNIASAAFLGGAGALPAAAGTAPIPQIRGSGFQFDPRLLTRGAV